MSNGTYRFDSTTHSKLSQRASSFALKKVLPSSLSLWGFAIIFYRWNRFLHLAKIEDWDIFLLYEKLHFSLWFSAFHSGEDKISHMGDNPDLQYGQC